MSSAPLSSLMIIDGPTGTTDHLRDAYHELGRALRVIELYPWSGNSARKGLLFSVAMELFHINKDWTCPYLFEDEVWDALEALSLTNEHDDSWKLLVLRARVLRMCLDEEARPPSVHLDLRIPEITMSCSTSFSPAAAGTSHWCESPAALPFPQIADMEEDAEVDFLIKFIEEHPDLPAHRRQYVITRAAEALNLAHNTQTIIFSVETKTLATLRNGQEVEYRGVWVDLYNESIMPDTPKEWEVFYDRLWELYNA
ncbi:hypothetical protein BC567DRAFT_212442 [Phyllosticta citribraziliensis]